MVLRYLTHLWRPPVHVKYIKIGNIKQQFYSTVATSCRPLGRHTLFQNYYSLIAPLIT